MGADGAARPGCRCPSTRGCCGAAGSGVHGRLDRPRSPAPTRSPRWRWPPPGAAAAAGHRDHPGLHPGARAARDERGGAGRGRARAVRARHRRVLAGRRRRLERGAVRASRSSAAATCCASCAPRSPARRSTGRSTRSGAPVHVWSGRRRCRRRSCSRRCGRGCCGWPPPRPTGSILNWLGGRRRGDAPAPSWPARRSGFEVAARIFVCPTEDAAYARAIGRRLIAAYLTVPAYAAFHRWLGRGEVLEPMWEAWAAGDRKRGARRGPRRGRRRAGRARQPERCRDAGATLRRRRCGRTPVMALLPTPELDRRRRRPPAGHAHRAAGSAVVERRGLRRSSSSPGRPAGSAPRWPAGSPPRVPPPWCSPTWTATPPQRWRPIAGGRRPEPSAVDVTDEEQVARAGRRDRGALRPDRPVLRQRRRHHRRGLEATDGDLGRGPGRSTCWRTSTRPARCCPACWSAASGYLLHTCSAAGLLTAVGDAPVRGDQARRGGVRRVAGDHLRRPGHQGQRAVPAGRATRRCCRTGSRPATSARR